MIDILRREVIYLWYYFSLQLEQIFGYWVLGMVLGSVIAVFAKDHIHGLFPHFQPPPPPHTYPAHDTLSLHDALPICLFYTA